MGGGENGEVMGKACRALWAGRMTWAYAVSEVGAMEGPNPWRVLSQ